MDLNDQMTVMVFKSCFIEGGRVVIHPRRKRVIVAASQCFAQFGYKATTMDLVSKIAKVSKGTIYTFFSTKEDLFEEILESVLRDVKDILNQEGRKEESNIKNLLKTLDVLHNFLSKHELFIKLLQEVRDIGTDQARSGIHRLENLVLDDMTNQILGSSTEEETREYDSSLLAFMMLKLHSALIVEWSEKSVPLNKEQIEESIEIFFKKLA